VEVFVWLVELLLDLYYGYFVFGFSLICFDWFECGVEYFVMVMVMSFECLEYIDWFC